MGKQDKIRGLHYRNSFIGSEPTLLDVTGRENWTHNQITPIYYGFSQNNAKHINIFPSDSSNLQKIPELEVSSLDFIARKKSSSNAIR